jgi:fructose-bisphosphate aldolase, class I
MSTDLGKTAQALAGNGMGILAADETVPTVTRRLAALSIESTPEIRRAYREMFFTTPGISDFISGVILQDETIHQEDMNGTPLADLLTRQGIIPSIKVDNVAKPLAGCPGERITEGLDGLRDRLHEYSKPGARFAKWRAVIEVSDTLPSACRMRANAHALARYAAICQEQDVVPIVEPEVLMNGSHTIERREEVTGKVLHAVFAALFEQDVSFEGMQLKPNVVVSGRECTRQAAVDEVAVAALRCLRQHVPAAVPGVIFLSGGQDHLTATIHLHAINQLEGPKPWVPSFSYGRALQDEALKAWHGNSENFEAGQRAFYHRAKCTSAAARCRYSRSMESELVVA